MHNNRETAEALSQRGTARHSDDAGELPRAVGSDVSDARTAARRHTALQLAVPPSLSDPPPQHCHPPHRLASQQPVYTALGFGSDVNDARTAARRHTAVTHHPYMPRSWCSPGSSMRPHFAASTAGENRCCGSRRMDATASPTNAANLSPAAASGFRSISSAGVLYTASTAATASAQNRAESRWFAITAEFYRPKGQCVLGAVANRLDDSKRLTWLDNNAVRRTF
jgi:hypothetical protein